MARKQWSTTLDEEKLKQFNEVCEQYGIIPIMMNYLDEDIIYKDTMEKSDIIAFYKQMEEGKVFKR